MTPWPPSEKFIHIGVEYLMIPYVHRGLVDYFTWQFTERVRATKGFARAETYDPWAPHGALPPIERQSAHAFARRRCLFIAALTEGDEFPEASVALDVALMDGTVTAKDIEHIRKNYALLACEPRIAVTWRP